MREPDYVHQARRRVQQKKGAGRNGAAQNHTPSAAERGPSNHDAIVNLTDLGNARRLVERHGRDLRYCHPWKKWLVFDGQRWREDATAEVVRRAKETQGDLLARSVSRLSELADDDSDESRVEKSQLKTIIAHCLKWEDFRRLNASVELASSEPTIPILPDVLDNDPMLFNVQNGTLDLRTGALREHRRDDYLTKLAPVEFDPSARCPRWLDFFHRIMGGKMELIGYLQRVAGYCLSGDCSEHALWFFYGQGANGKSTYLSTLLHLFGDYGAQAVSELLMQRAHEQHPTERADLFGRRFVATIETDEGKRLAESLMKQATGGDKIRARKLYQDFFEFTPTHKIFLAANHLPIVKGTDFAVWRRIKLVPFVVTIPPAEQDRQLAAKLKSEAPGILNWALAGCLEWQRNGLSEPEDVQAATAAYRAEQDTFASFIAECCFVHSEARARASALFDAFGKFSGDKTLTQTAFGRKLKDRGFENRRGSGGTWFWHGLGIADSGDSDGS
jgi:putative DNA primase/helicase